MKNKREWIPVLVRTLLGGIFIISGTNNYLSFMPESAYTAEGTAFIVALQESGYLFDLIKAMEILGGTMLVLNLFVPIVILLLAPIIVNIFLFELFLSNTYMVIPTILLMCEAYLFYEYRHLFTWLFKYQVHTHTNDERPPEVLLLDQLKEDHPEEYEHIMHVKGVKDMVLR